MYDNLIVFLKEIFEKWQLLLSADKLTNCMLGNFSCLSCRLLTFQNYLFSKISYYESA